MSGRDLATPGERGTGKLFARRPGTISSNPLTAALMHSEKLPMARQAPLTTRKTPCLKITIASSMI
jgi:hypothetical protein